MYQQMAQECLTAIEPLMPYQAAAFYRITPEFTPTDYVLRHMRQDMHARYEQHYHRLDPLLPSRVAAAHEVVTLDQGVAAAPGMQQAYRQQFLLPFDMADVVEVFIRDAGQAQFGVSLLRGPSLGRFTLADQRLLTRLLPMLRLATQPLAALAAKRPGPALTSRERQVMQLVAQGASNKVIARALDISLATVKTHLIHLFEKFDVDNRTQLASHAAG